MLASVHSPSRQHRPRRGARILSVRIEVKGHRRGEDLAQPPRHRIGDSLERRYVFCPRATHCYVACGIRSSEHRITPSIPTISEDVWTSITSRNRALAAPPIL